MEIDQVHAPAERLPQRRPKRPTFLMLGARSISARHLRRLREASETHVVKFISFESATKG